ncbi:MAG: HEAT repeat domain-containing protein [Actinomycetota bacterium]
MAPPDLTTLTWTTRAEVAAQLARYLRDTGPPPDLEAAPEPSPRVRATELLRILAVPSQRLLLRALALNHGEEVEVRRNALWALERLGFGLSGGDLQRLLSDSSLYGDGDGDEDEDQWFGAEDLLTLARRPDAQAVARRYLLTLSPKDRTQLLAETRLVTPTPLMEWMYGKWLHEDRHLLATDRGPWSANQSVISMMRERVESRAVLQEMWRASRGEERRELLDALHDDEIEWEFPGELTAAETTELAEVLALPTEALVAYWGRERLLELLDKRLLDEHTRQETQRRLRKVNGCDLQAFVRVLRVLRQWSAPDLNEWIAARALGAKLHEEVRWWLMDTLWRRNRAFAATAIIAALVAGECSLARLFVNWAARNPIESDQMMLREASRPIYSAEFQYYGLCGLARLGESGDEWLSRLDAWTRHAEPRLRIRALGVLARRGDPDARAALLVWTEGRHAVHERAEAIAVLAEVDAPGQFPLLVRALADEERPEPRSRCAPVAEEAALAIARLGAPEALTALLRSHLTTGCDYVRGAVGLYLSVIINATSGASPIIDPPTPEFGYWRLELRPRWTESS